MSTNDEIDAQIETLQTTVRESRTKIAELRRERTPEPMADYALTGVDGPAPLASLFGERDELVVVHNMGRSCPMCTTWADGLNGLLHHIENKMAFAVSTPDPVAEQQEFAAARGWSFRMVSTAGTSFAKDLGFEGEHEGKPFPYPGVSIFTRGADGGVARVASSFFGPGDDYCALWSLFDLLPGGQGDWWPKLDYGT